MPALDYCHPIVVRALENDGWTVNFSPSPFYVEGRYVFIDIQASRGGNGSAEQVLLAEIKCFPDRTSTTRELYIAVGQYIIYRTVLAELQNPTPLYLAVPATVYESIFDSTVKRAISDNRIKIVVVHLDEERIVQWIE